MARKNKNLNKMDESNIPIDINIGKLQDWLVSRRHVNKEWQKNIIAVREKINNAIQDMPAHDDIASLLSGTYINYFHCQKIIEILKETEADTKNLFGRYGSQRMKDWQDVVKSYEKENLYLAEAAQILVRNISYEIPGLKKQIAKEEQLQVECEKKNTDYLKNEASSKSEFLSLCKQLGIQGNKIKRELVDRLMELPEIYDKIGKSLKPLLPAIELYTAFTKYILGERATEVLPLLQYVIQHGNTTVYEWSYGEPPLSVEPDPVHIEFDDEEQGGGDQIDFGDSNEIDFGSIDTGAIDFGDGDGAAEIDWGNIGEAPAENVDLSANIAEISLEESGIVVEDQGVQGGVARGKDALTLLDNPATRNQVIDQLLELESFLKMRLYETNTSNEQSFSLIQQLPTESAAALTAMLDSVQVASSRLTAPEVNHLHNVKHSPRYVDVLTAQLKQKLALCDKLSKLAARSGEQRALSTARAAQLRPALARLVDRTRELQAQIEADISKKYKGRPVNIIGGVKFL
ncbi:CDK5 regulatory subunit-associated protein 3 [Amyelois transitella]|uniref:CDK5 regulatory subunit-associated protein 3 n=1 Tax=Amyelois transitella TaxID=680683 RepID=UPI00298F5C64|nr:CDK5 regulatory subunit-associated protein 3 [Amyelois transitella]XP_060802009.1 CDK5 regulatory subunit-associated protein 3 [Amyelois transitella]